MSYCEDLFANLLFFFLIYYARFYIPTSDIIANIELTLRQEIVRFRVGLIYSNGTVQDPLEMMHVLPVSHGFHAFCHIVMGAATTFNPHSYLEPGCTYTWKNKQSMLGIRARKIIVFFLTSIYFLPVLIS
jgi:hypothetical protein